MKPYDDSKRKELQRRGSLHPHPERVTDPLFESNPFFDRHDAVQVKYEMLRRVRIDGWPVARAAAESGFSRPTFYEARASFERAGMPGLLPAKKGPQRAHKLSKTVMSFIDEELAIEPSLTMAALARRVHERFGITVDPRSVKRALVRRVKKTL
jgi:transposase